MTEVPKPDEITSAELKLLTRLHIVSPSRDSRAKRAAVAIKDQGKALAIIGKGANERPVTFADAFEIVYGRTLDR